MGNVFFPFGRIIKKKEKFMGEYINEIRYDSRMAKDFFAEKLAFTLGPVELKTMMSQNKVKVIDVRQKEDYDDGHIPDAISIPKAELADRLGELSNKGLHVVYCYNQQCHLGAAAALVLAKNSYPVMELDGGFKVWDKDFKFDVVKS